MISKDDLLVLAGAVIGGTLGYFAFHWVAGQGFYGLVLPGGLLSLGAGVFRARSIIIAVICGVLAISLGLFTEWRFAPFRADASLGYFLTHVHKLEPMTLIMIAVGGCLGFWVPFRRLQNERNS